MSATATEEGKDTDVESGGVMSPIIVNLGKKPRKRVKRLKKGKGKLMDRVADTIDEVCASLEGNEQVVPVIVIVREKPKKKMKFWPFM